MPKIKALDKKLIFALLTGFILRLFLSQYLTLYQDLYTFQLWSLDLIRHGFKNFYNVAISDYLPGYLYILWATGKVFYFINAKLFVVEPELIFKLPAIFFDLANTVLIYLTLQKFTSQKKSFLVSLLYLFNPFVIANSTLWGQVESVMMFWLLGSLYFFLNKKYYWSGLFLGIAQAVKPIAVVAAPFYIVSFLKDKNLKALLKWTLSGLIAFFVLFIPFSNKTNLFSFAVERGFLTVGFWNYTTLSAFNFWNVASNILEGSADKISKEILFLGINFDSWGKFLFGGSLIIFLANFFKHKPKKTKAQNLIFFLALSYMAMFHFVAGMHERHLYYALTFLLLLLPLLSKLEKYLLTILSGTYVLNLFWVYHQVNDIGFTLPASLPLLISLLNLLIFFVLIFKLSKK